MYETTKLYFKYSVIGFCKARVGAVITFFRFKLVLLLGYLFF